MRKLLLLAFVVTTTYTYAQSGGLNPDVQVGLGGALLWQDVGGNYSGYVNCTKFTKGNQRKGSICKMFPNLNGSMDVCDGKIQTISDVIGDSDFAHVDSVFLQGVEFAQKDFGNPTSLTSGQGFWNLGDVKLLVHEVYDAPDNHWVVYMDVYSDHSRRASTGCTEGGVGKYGSVVK